MRLSPETFNAIRAAVYELCGLVIADDKSYLIVSRLEPVLRRNGLPSFDALAERLAQFGSLALQEEVIEAITTKETSFNRDGHPFDELRRLILPGLAARLLERRAALKPLGAKCRIWCAAAATGQEVYSVAMAVADFLANRPGIGLTLDDFPILATDISRAALAVAREGRYSNTEIIRGVTPEHRDRYFRHVHGGWVVDEKLRRGVEFLRVNLARPFASLGTFDLVLCRNLLIYFDEAARRRLCQGFHHALEPGGILILGAAESLYGVSEAFRTERLGTTFIHRKT